MHALLRSFNSGNWSDSKVLDSAGLSCRAFMRNRGPTTTKSDEQSQEEEKIKSRFHGKGKKLRLIIENNHFYSDKLG
ncbi:hypothetical protein JHK84_045056 [Glycine max]|nr:hypothetical protein JHK84_045056 [Glycine max]